MDGSKYTILKTVQNRTTNNAIIMGRKRKHSKKGKKDYVSDTTNPLYKKQQQFLQSLSEKERTELFNPEIDSDRRATLWMEQADLGESKKQQQQQPQKDHPILYIISYFSLFYVCVRVPTTRTRESLCMGDTKS